MKDYRLSDVSRIVPLHDWVLAEVREVRTTASGIYISEEDEATKAYVVLKAGPGRVSEFGALVPMTAHEEMVLSLSTSFSHGVQQIPTDDGKEYVMFRDKDCMYQRTES
jgi:co-chaperonin GroES (HSP10)